MKRLTINAYEWKELSDRAKEKAADFLCAEADEFSPTPAVILLAIQTKN